MGYESRLFVVSKSDTPYDDWYVWGQLIATLNLSRISDKMLSHICEHPVTNCCFYDGFSEMVLKDKYGKPLREVPVGKMIEYLEEAIKEDDYRRYPPALAILKAFDSDPVKWKDLVVLHYGY